MKNLEWTKAQEIFADAVEMDGENRRELLDGLALEDKFLRNELHSILSADEMISILPNSIATLTEGEVPALFTNRERARVTGFRKGMIEEVLDNRYLIVRHLGGGGMGDVFLAKDQNVMNRDVVVKLLKNDVLQNPEVVRKFQQEVEALSRVKDEAIVTIYDSGTYGEQPYLVLEYVEGEDLSKIISPLLFGKKDFIDPDQIARKLRERKSAEMEHVSSLMSQAGREYLLTNDSEISAILADEFSNILLDWSLYNEKAFADFPLSSTTTGLLNRREEAGRTMDFNRALLEELFPGEIVRGEKKKLTNRQVADVFNQLCIALGQGHAKGVIHRDLKPANIMLTEIEGRGLRVKLIDFGVARVRESLVAPTTLSGMIFGTPSYMSPEQLTGKADLTPAADIYALGIIALEILTGKNPFSRKSQIEQHKLQENIDSQLFSNQDGKVSLATAAVIRKALAYAPGDRFATAREFGMALNASLEDDAVRAESVTVPSLRSINEIQSDDNRDKQAAHANINIKGRTGIPALALVMLSLLIISVTAGLGWLMWKQTGQTDAPAVASVINTEKSYREIGYDLQVQKYYQGKPFQKPFKATGEEIFGDGWRFRLNLSSQQDGHLYLLTEGTGDKGGIELVMLFPHPQRNAGLSLVKNNTPVETNEMEFDKNQGAEKFWIIWTKEPVPDLEAVKSYVNPKDLGTIKDPAQEKNVRTFLEKGIGNEKISESTDENKRSRSLRSTGDILIKLAEFRHN